MNKDRKRLIICATDNELNSEPYVTLTDAAALCKKYDVKVFAVATDYVQEEEVFKAAIANTGGKYYVGSQSGAYKQLVKDIEMTDTSEMTKTITRVYEQPQVLFICMVIFIGVYLVISRKVKL